MAIPDNDIDQLKERAVAALNQLNQLAEITPGMALVKRYLTEGIDHLEKEDTAAATKWFNLAVWSLRELNKQGSREPLIEF